MTLHSENNVNCNQCSGRFNSVFCMVHNKDSAIEKERTYTEYKKGEIIFKEGTRPFGIYCLNHGKVKLVKNGEDGRDQIVRLVKPGGPFGYRSLLSDGHYYASAIAIEDSGVCFIPKDIYIEILKNDASLSFEMLKMLGEDLKKAEQQMTHLAQKPVRERVAEALIFIKDTYGFEEDGMTIDASFSREDIANIVGTATETTIRLLSEFNKDGIIKLIGKKIEIINYDKLVKTANVFE